MTDKPLFDRRIKAMEIPVYGGRLSVCLDFYDAEDDLTIEALEAGQTLSLGPDEIPALIAALQEAQRLHTARWKP